MPTDRVLRLMPPAGEYFSQPIQDALKSTTRRRATRVYADVKIGDLEPEIGLVTLHFDHVLVPRHIWFRNGGNHAIVRSEKLEARIKAHSVDDYEHLTKVPMGNRSLTCQLAEQRIAIIGVPKLNEERAPETPSVDCIVQLIQEETKLLPIILGNALMLRFGQFIVHDFGPHGYASLEVEF
ncbi:MAG: hypothetical protein AAB152_12230 [Candidatus Coatesbacteria bacterium]